VFIRRCAVVLLPLVLIAAACSGDDDSSAPEGEDADAATTTAAPELVSASTGEFADTGWEQHVPGGDCECADGSEFSFWSHEGDPNRVMLFFMGGGACFSPETCSFTDGTYTVTADTDLDAFTTGIFDFENADNPFRDWSMVFVPYCTGDVHLGNAEHDYGDGLVVQHKGFVNASAGLDYVVDTYPDAEHLFVTGSSAGGVPAPLFAALASDEMPDTEIAALSDASGAYPDNPPVNEAIGSLWGTFNNVPDWPETQDLEPADWSIPGAFVVAGEHDPDLRFARYDAAYDEVQQNFSTLSGISDGDLFDIIQANEAGIEDEGVSVSSYIAPGTVHTILGDDALYTLEVEGIPLLDWLTDFVDGGTPDDVVCTDCENPADA
jgi:hypothetical protein